MPIRPINTNDLEAVSALCLAAFKLAVAPSLTAEGVQTFAAIAAADAFASRMQGDNLLLVFVEQDAVRGVIELKEGRHVAMLFVDPAHQRRGIGRQLLAAALQQARTEEITVKASLSSVPAYQGYGFSLSGEVGEAAGLVYQPLTMRRPEY